MISSNLFKNGRSTFHVRVLDSFDENCNSRSSSAYLQKPIAKFEDILGSIYNMARRWILKGQTGWNATLEYQANLKVPLAHQLSSDNVLVEFYAACESINLNKG